MQVFAVFALRDVVESQLNQTTEDGLSILTITQRSFHCVFSQNEGDHSIMLTKYTWYLQVFPLNE